jgi:hypothetical protein
MGSACAPPRRLSFVFAMAGPLGSCNSCGDPAPDRPPLAHGKHKGCKKKKCSNWKGGKCRCGRD